MAHYALINSDNIVVHVITGVDENIIQTDLDGTQVGGSSEAWEAFYALQPQFAGLTCKQTSYNGNIRKNYAGIGFEYRSDLDAFIAPQPYPSWVLDEDAKWQPPTPYPSGDGIYQWVEDDLNWQLVEGV